MHWLTFIFGFLTIYCGAAFLYVLNTSSVTDSREALVILAAGVVIFALASFINQKRHAYAKKSREQ